MQEQPSDPGPARPRPSALAFIAEPRDVAAAAQACRHFERAASFEAAWQHCWYALIAGKVYVPPRAAALQQEERRWTRERRKNSTGSVQQV